MASSAQYVASPKIGAIFTNTAEANFTTTFKTPSNAVTVFTAGTSGSRIDQVNVSGLGITVASQLRLFIHDGTNFRFLRDIPITAITPSTTLSAFNASLCSQYNPELFPILLPTGYSLRATLSTAQTNDGVMITAIGGDF
jgi:hypothetical protein